MTARIAGILREPVNPWLIHDVEIAARSALCNRWLLPTGEIDMSDGVDWGREFSNGGNSKKLWLHSLPFISDLISYYLRSGEVCFFKHALALLENYFEWIRNDASHHKAAWRDEHAVANRSCVMAAILYYSRVGDLFLSDDFAATIKQHLLECGWFLAEPAHYVSNNHGVMMDRALLQISLLFDGQPDYDYIRHWRQLALSRTLSMLDKTFDGLGCCTENSPAYQFVNIDLFQSVASFYEAHGFGSEAEEIAGRLVSARKVAALMLRSDFSLPLIGDSILKSSLYSQALIPNDVHGSGFYPDSGFYIHKGESLHLTMKCGGLSHSHRHLDDTSITCRYLGFDLIVDGGLYNYDSSDPIRKYFFSSSAHSGIFFDRCSEISRLWDYPDPPRIGRMVDYFKDEVNECCTCESSYFAGSTIRRSLMLLSSNCFLLVDTIVNEDPAPWKQQFNLHPACTVELKGTSAVVRRAGIGVEFRFLDGVKCSVRDSWYSESFGNKVLSKQLYIASDQPMARTLVRFFGRGFGELLDARVQDRSVTTEQLLRFSSTHYQIDPCSWIVAGNGLDIENVAGYAVVSGSFEKGFCYIQSGSGRFEQIDTSGASRIPSDVQQAHVSLKLESFESFRDTGSSEVWIFFMQYSAEGGRVCFDKIQPNFNQNIGSVDCNFRLDGSARYWKIAIKFQNLLGSMRIHPVLVAYS